MIQLVLSSLPVDEIPGNIALATFFEDIRPLKGATSLIDWRLNGRLSDLILGGRVGGNFAECLIMPSQGRLQAREILMFGLGRSCELNEQSFESGFSVMIDKLMRLKSGEIVVSFGDLARDFMGWRSVLRSFMNALSLKYEEDVQVICSEDVRWINEARKRNMDFGPKVQLSYA